MKKTIRASGTYYFRRSDKPKRTAIAEFDETFPIDIPATEVSVVSFVQNRVISGILKEKNPGYINWQSCAVSIVEATAEAPKTKTPKNIKGIVIE